MRAAALGRQCRLEVLVDEGVGYQASTMAGISLDFDDMAVLRLSGLGQDGCRQHREKLLQRQQGIVS